MKDDFRPPDGLADGLLDVEIAVDDLQKVGKLRRGFGEEPGTTPGVVPDQPPDPRPLAQKPLDQVAPDESPRPRDQNLFIPPAQRPSSLDDRVQTAPRLKPRPYN